MNAPVPPQNLTKAMPTDFFTGNSLIILSALFGSIAGVIRSLSDGETWKRALIKSGLTFTICLAFGAAIQHLTALPELLIFGVVGVAGMATDRLMIWYDRIVDAAGMEAVEKIRGEKNMIKPDPEGDEDFLK